MKIRANRFAGLVLTLAAGPLLAQSGQTFKECRNCPEMVVLPAGTFMMGSTPDDPMRRDNERLHEITFARPFAMSATPVTWNQWEACVRDGWCDGIAVETALATLPNGEPNPNHQDQGRGTRPVVGVSWYDAQAFVGWLNAKAGEDDAYRLPSEAEWEYGARAGTSTTFPWGDEIDHNYGNFGSDVEGRLGGKAEGRDVWVDETSPVASFPPNAFGLYDMHGNIFEWTEDCYEADRANAPTDGSANREGNCVNRIFRSGTFLSNPYMQRSARRGAPYSATRRGLNYIGFRVAKTLDAVYEAKAEEANSILIPHSSWSAYMPEGIPYPEDGTLIFKLEIPLDRAVNVGTTPFGERSVAVGLEGTVEGPRLSGTVMEGALDFMLTLANGTVEIEQILVLRAAEGSYVYVHNAGTGPDTDDIRIVMDFEAPVTSEHAWLNEGTFVARRELNRSASSMTLRVYDVSDVPVDTAKAITIAKPENVPAQPWDYRRKAAWEQLGEVLITENVTLGPSQAVGESKRGNRNVIPITGGEVEGRIIGRVLMGGADFQSLSPPVTIDARYLWQTDDGEIIIVRNGGSFGALVPTFEARVDGPYAYLNDRLYLSSNPSVGDGGVGLTFYESAE